MLLRNICRGLLVTLHIKTGRIVSWVHSNVHVRTNQPGR